MIAGAALVAALAVAPSSSAADPEGSGPGRQAQRSDQSVSTQHKAAQQGQHSGQSAHGAQAGQANKGTGQKQQAQQAQSGQRAAQGAAQGAVQGAGQGAVQGAGQGQGQKNGQGAEQAQSGQRAEQGQTRQRATQDQKGQGAAAQQGARQGAGQAGGDREKATAQNDAAGTARTQDYMGLNANFSMPLTNRCVYNAQVRGVVETGDAGARKDTAKNLRPDLHIDASLDCPNQPTVKVTETIAPGRAMTRSELESELERRGTITAPDHAGRCAYAPDFALTENFFGSSSVTYMCSLNWPVPRR